MVGGWYKRGRLPETLKTLLCLRGRQWRCNSELVPGLPLPQYSRFQMAPLDVSLVDWNIEICI